MTRIARTIAVGSLALGAGLFVAAAPAGASPAVSHQRPDDNGRGAVFVQTDALTGNQVIAYDRAQDGTLTQAGSYATGGLGGHLTGAAVDNTASQGALAADRANRTLIAVNPGSNTVSVLAVHGDQLALRQVVGAGGTFPVSVTVHDNRVFVLDARDGGAIQGYLDLGGHLVPVPAWHRDLGLDPTATPEFTHTPGQVAFTPDGKHLIVTTKANTNSILVYDTAPFGHLSVQPVTYTDAGSVPFAVAFDSSGHLLVTETGHGTVVAFSVAADGTLTALSSTPTGQAATCWITTDGDLAVASNAGSASVSSLSVNAAGGATLLATTATGAGTVDATFTPDGTRLYVQTGAAGAVDSFAVGTAGVLQPLGTVTVPNAVGGEGIVAW